MTVASATTGDCTEPCTTIWTIPGEVCTLTDRSHRCAHLNPDHPGDHRCACQATVPRKDTHPGR